jgi:hypothetical protein
MRIANLYVAFLGMAGVMLLAFVTSGQDKLGLAGPGDSLRVALLRTPQIQQELKLKSQQIEKISRIGDQAKTAKKKIEEAHGKGKGQKKAQGKVDDPISKEQERMVREAMETVLVDLEGETDQQLNEILDGRQRTRLTQIVLRIEGPSAFLTPELIDALAMGPEQIELIREILADLNAAQEQHKESQKRASELAKATGDSSLEKVRKDQQKGQSRAFAYKLNNQVMPRIGRVLTRRQRDIYNRMLGDSFDLTKLTGPEGQPLIDDSADLAGALLRDKAVQDELKLTSQQKEQLAKGSLADKVLDSRQRSRLRQIVFQGEGLSALNRPDVLRALRLDDDQLEQIQEVMDNLLAESKQLREILKSEAAGSEPGDADQDATRKDQEKARMRAGSKDVNERSLRQIRAILTPRQRTTFTNLGGEPFDFSKLQVRLPGR